MSDHNLKWAVLESSLSGTESRMMEIIQGKVIVDDPLRAQVRKEEWERVVPDNLRDAVSFSEGNWSRGSTFPTRHLHSWATNNLRSVQTLYALCQQVQADLHPTVTAPLHLVIEPDFAGDSVFVMAGFPLTAAKVVEELIRHQNRVYSTLNLTPPFGLRAMRKHSHMEYTYKVDSTTLTVPMASAKVLAQLLDQWNEVIRHRTYRLPTGLKPLFMPHNKDPFPNMYRRIMDLYAHGVRYLLPTGVESYRHFQDFVSLDTFRMRVSIAVPEAQAEP